MPAVVPRRHRAPSAPWVRQTAKNLVLDLEDAGCRARFLIRDRDGKSLSLVDTVPVEMRIAHEYQHAA